MKRIGVDTNIVLRLVTGDDLRQLAIAEDFQEKVFERGDRIFLNLVVVVESVWALRQIFKFSKDAICTTLEYYLTNQRVEVEDGEVVWEALKLYRETSADFADCLILVSNQKAGVSETMTFDRKASKVAGFSLLA